MCRFVLTGAAVLMGFLPTLAQERSDSNSPKPERQSTFSSVKALANMSGPAMSEPDRRNARNTVDSVRALAGPAKDENQEPAENPKPREPKQMVRNNVREREPVEGAKNREVEPVRKQVQRRPKIDRDRQQGDVGFQPAIGDHFMGGWGNGFYSNQIIGFRSYRYSGYGNGFGYGYPYLYPGYGYGYGYGFGYGFSPVMPSISGPVTKRYADPVGRQYKMMDDSIRKFAEGR